MYAVLVCASVFGCVSVRMFVFVSVRVLVLVILLGCARVRMYLCVRRGVCV